MIVKNILQAKARGAGIVTIGPDSTIPDAARMLGANRIGALVVVGEEGGIAGILSERDIVNGIAKNGDPCLRMAVRDLMTADVVVCHENDTIDSLSQIMTSQRIRHLPVVDGDNRLVGMVTIGDVVKSRLELADLEVDNLRHYVVASR
jgi:CBS domain-containing protein